MASSLGSVLRPELVQLVLPGRVNASRGSIRGNPEDGCPRCAPAEENDRKSRGTTNRVKIESDWIGAKVGRAVRQIFGADPTEPGRWEAFHTRDDRTGFAAGRVDRLVIGRGCSARNVRYLGAKIFQQQRGQRGHRDLPANEIEAGWKRVGGGRSAYAVLARQGKSVGRKRSPGGRRTEKDVERGRASSRLPEEFPRRITSFHERRVYNLAWPPLGQSSVDTVAGCAREIHARTPSPRTVAEVFTRQTNAAERDCARCWCCWCVINVRVDRVLHALPFVSFVTRSRARTACEQ